MMRIPCMLCMLLVAAFLTGMLPSVGAQTPSEVGTFEPADCAFVVPFGQDVDCGYLTVPERHADPDGDTLRLHVAIFRSSSPNPAPDPIVYLEGGPGGSATKLVSSVFSLVFEPFIDHRDLVVFDQRGTGYSEPALNCPEANELLFDIIGDELQPEDNIALQLGAVNDCMERLTGEGVHLDAYNSAENAADLDMLREALGYDTWNLYGISYGTRLGLTAMRDFPDGIRSVILDSSYPPDADLYATVAPNFVRSLNVLFADCEASERCRAAYPNLETVFYETVRRLDENPVHVEGTLPSTQETYDIMVSGGVFAGFVFQSLYQSAVLSSLPQIIYAAQQDDFVLMSVLYMAYLDGADRVSYGMQLAVQCGEEVPFGDVDVVVGQARDYPEIRSFLTAQLNLGKGLYAVCANWVNATPNPQENEAVVSDIPTLVMAGEYDPITPPDWGREVASTLENSYFFEYSGVGHGASVSGECPTDMALAFLDDPTTEPDSSCMSALGAPNFAVIETSITMVPFTDESLQISGLVPENWVEIAPGIYGRTEIGDVALLYLSLPGTDADMLLDLMLAQMGYNETPEIFDTFTTVNDLEWQVYDLEYQGFGVRMALAAGGDTMYLILLQAPLNEIDTLYGSVMLPAMHAFKPLD